MCLTLLLPGQRSEHCCGASILSALETTGKKHPNVQNKNLLKKAVTMQGEQSTGEELLHAMCPPARNKHLQGGTEVPYGLAARGANFLQRLESMCFSGLTAEQNLYESGICSRAAFKQPLHPCQRERILIFTSSGCLENVLRERVLANMCEEQRFCQSSAQLLKPSISTFKKYRLLSASFCFYFLKSSLLEAQEGGEPSTWDTGS